MTGKIIKMGNPHYCEIPNLHKWKNRKLCVEGTQWQCDDCNAIYEVKFSRFVGHVWRLQPNDNFSGNQEMAS